MAREHTPIQIGLPIEPAWQVAEQPPVSFVAFIAGEELPDPGAAFVAAGEAFGMAPQDVEPVPVDDEMVGWAFSFTMPGRSARAMVWCERVPEGGTPDGRAPDAKWVILIETLLECARAVDDAAALVATVARAAGSRLRLVLDPGIGVVWSPDDLARLFLSAAAKAAGGSMLDQRSLYRIEVASEDRSGVRGKGPFWITTVGLARVGKPELELLEVPAELLRPAFELIDAVASRCVDEELPHAGVPYEVGTGFRVTLVPAAEACETLPAGMPGSAASRRGLPPHPRAAICAVGRRGAYRPVWLPPIAELEAFARHELGIYVAPRVSLVRERLAQEQWVHFVAALARGGDAGARFVAKIARGDTVGEREHVWVAVAQATESGGRGTLLVDGRPVEFARAALGDWRILGLSAAVPEAGPESAALLAAGH